MLKRFTIILATLVVAFFYAEYEKRKINGFLELSEKITLQKNLDLKELPEISLKEISGEEKDIRQLSTNSGKKYVFVHFWATWCAPCEAEFPALLNSISKSDSNMHYILVAVNDKKEKMNKFLKRFEKTISDKKISILMDDNDFYSSKFGTTKVPETYIFETKTFKSVRKFVGPQDWLRKSYMNFFNTLK